ncbi:EAL domain-containing protein [Deinococcus taeanensis]|uniref:putative bifunctional diguanylate cyclase/phosphodiesterase n=1 Tax=Deinococcus taeanensis TaxID=2737050 RepID=UPI001CDC3495|nr:EAL domain-containing protein [Deinococcus taeanensis]UBV42462.1 EAL domain-containing protein [Deinococcus taeanensis]
MLSRLTSALSPAPRPDGTGLADAIVATTDVLVVVLDPLGRVVQFNPACERLTGLQYAALRGQVLWPFVLDAAERAGVQAAFERLMAGTAPRRHEHHWRTLAGERRLILWSCTVIPDPRGGVAFVVGTGMDVTREREAQQAQAESEARFRALFDRSADGLVLLDPHDPLVPWRIVDCNAAFCHMNGYERHELLGQSIDLLHSHPMMARDGPDLLHWIREEQPARGEGAHLHRNGSVFPIESASSIVTLSGQELILGQDRDITARHRTEERLRRLAEQLAHESQHDPLTGLPNRALLLERLQLELRRSVPEEQTLAVVAVGLDGFRRVNDTLGHAAGDDLLRETARRLRDAACPAHTVARTGGDEFTVIIPAAGDPEGALRAARALHRVVAEPLHLNGQLFPVRASLGVAVCPPDSSLPANLLRQADMAMAQAKRDGGHTTRLFSKALDLAAHGQLHLEVRLRRAVQEGGLHLHYQPQVDAHTGALLGFEALVRWTDTKLGAVPPARLIPVAEDTGLIHELGAWVLNEACRQAAEWRLRVPVAVNVSAAELIREDFTARVRAALARHGLRGTQLKLELTERFAPRDLRRASAHLTQLRALGVQLSLDDFGTGHAPVATLMGLPLNELKLDRALTAAVAGSAAEQRVVGALISLGRSLNLNVVVEGVETQEQLQALRDLGCSAVQGYLTGRPGPPEVWTTLLETLDA